MSKCKSIRGTYDLFGSSLDKFILVEKTVKQLSKLYSFEEIRTPILEYSEVFEKNIGEQSDIIGKEMYVFSDKKGESIALRPEGTAPVVRALISNGLLHRLPLKYFYIGPMFRYERPQKGRQRQFHQLGFEYLGTNHYSSDVEMINLAIDILSSLNISSYKLLINTLGGHDSLEIYKKQLISYLHTKKMHLSEDSSKRLEHNPLRVLDSKDYNDQEIIKEAPKVRNYLIPSDAIFFDKVLEGLNSCGISYIENDNLVRGLDYYTQTVFELVTEELGSQGALIAGGRYNNLIGNMGGDNTGAFGFAGGIERLAMMIKEPKEELKSVAIIASQEQHDNYALSLSKKIRSMNYGSSFILGKNVSSKLKKIDQNKFFCTIILNDLEVSTKNLTIKDATTREQFKISEDLLSDFFSSQYKEYKIKE